MNRRDKVIEISIIIDSLLRKVRKMDTRYADSEGEILLRKILNFRYCFHYKLDALGIDNVLEQAIALRGERWYIIDDGEMFEGHIGHFRDCFFSNANEENIISWCENQGYRLQRTYEGYL